MAEDSKEIKERDRPVVSVIIPSYNAALTLKKAVDSALSQEVPVEVLVVDDASSDKTKEVMEQYGHLGNVFYFKNERNLGAAASRNFGVAHAVGKYVAFLDADDYWHQGKLKKQLACMREKKAVLCSTARELLAPDGRRTGRIIGTKENITYRMMLHQNHINCSSVVLLRRVAEEFPMEKDEVHEDYLTWLRILRKYKRACAVNEPLLAYRLTTSGKSGNKFHSAKLTYGVYRQLGLGRIKSLICFCSYAVCGVWKYMNSR